MPLLQDAISGLHDFQDISWEREKLQSGKLCSDRSSLHISQESALLCNFYPLGVPGLITGVYMLLIVNVSLPTLSSWDTVRENKNDCLFHTLNIIQPHTTTTTTLSTNSSQARLQFKTYLFIYLTLAINTLNTHKKKEGWVEMWKPAILVSSLTWHHYSNSQMECPLRMRVLRGGGVKWPLFQWPLVEWA